MIEKIAVAAVDAMKTQPLAVALVVMNMLFLAASGYVIVEVSGAYRVREERRDQLLSQITKSCFDKEDQRPES
jgi:hypothetical protein